MSSGVDPGSSPAAWVGDAGRGQTCIFSLIKGKASYLTGWWCEKLRSLFQELLTDHHGRDFAF